LKTSRVRGNTPHRAVFPQKNPIKYSAPLNNKSTLSINYAPENVLNRSFYSSKFFLTDDKKKAAPIDPKLQQTRKTTTMEQGSSTSNTMKSAVIPTPGSTQTPRTVVRGPEDLNDIKANISKLLDNEIETVRDEAVAIDVQSDLTKQFLAKTKYEIIEGKEGEVTLKRVQGVHTISVMFNKNEPAESQEMEQMDEDPEASAKETEDLVGKEGENSMPIKQSIQVEVAFSDKKSKWILGGFAGKDNRLYIEDMSIAQQPEKVEAAESAVATNDAPPLEALPFESLSDELQDRIYDFLDEVHVDDQLAHFVKFYTAESETKSAVKFLQNLKELMGTQ